MRSRRENTNAVESLARTESNLMLRALSVDMSHQHLLMSFVTLRLVKLIWWLSQLFPRQGQLLAKVGTARSRKLVARFDDLP